MSELWGVWSEYDKEWFTELGGSVFATSNKSYALAQTVMRRRDFTHLADEYVHISVRSSSDIAREKCKSEVESLRAKADSFCVRSFNEWAESEGLE